MLRDPTMPTSDPSRWVLLEQTAHGEHLLGSSVALLADPNARRLTPAQAIAVVRRATASDATVRHRTLALLGCGGFAVALPRASIEQSSALEAQLRRGQLVVIERRRALPPYGHHSLEGIEAQPAVELTPLDDGDKSLLITRCDALLGEEPLNFSYLLRALAGQPVELRIHASGLPDSVVHRRLLAATETLDGKHDAKWDGRVTSPGPLFDRRLPARHSPCRIELYADASYRDEAPFTIAKPQVPVVEFESGCFGRNRVILLADVEPPEEHRAGRTRSSALSAVEAVLRHVHGDPEVSLFVAGHGEVGNEAPELSTLRAQNVQLYLLGDEEGWGAHCAAHYEVADQQRVLAWIARYFPEFDCDPQGVDDVLGPATRAAQQRFRDRYGELNDEQLGSGDRLGVADWRAFCSLYDSAVRALLGDEIDLDELRAKLCFCEPASRGFGESFSRDRGQGPGSACDRRVEVVAFKDPEKSVVDDVSGADLYGPQAVVEREYLALDQVGGPWHVCFVDDEAWPAAALDIQLETIDTSLHEATSDSGGMVLFANVRAGAASLRIVALDRVAWDVEGDAGVAESAQHDETPVSLALDLRGLIRAEVAVEVEVGGEARVVLERPLLRFAVPDVLRCDHASTLLVPAPWTDDWHPLAAVARGLRALVDAPERWLLVIGHASAPGSEAGNQALSEHRADAVRALVENDADAWVEHARERGSLRDVLAYLDYLGRKRGWSCSVDASVAELGTEETSLTRSAVSAFQSDYNARFDGSLAIDGVCGTKTLGAVFEVLYDELERWLDKLGRTPEQVPLDRVAYVGYGATLAGREGEGSAAEAADRVVDLVVIEGIEFDPDIDPAEVFTSTVARRRPLVLPKEPDEWATGPFTIVSDLTPEEPALPETYRLSSEDGAWNAERVLPDEGEVEAGELVLHFPRLPTEHRYSLVVVSNGGNESVIFENLAYGQLHDESPKLS